MADQIMNYYACYRKTSEMGRRICVIFVKTAALKSHIVHKINYKPKSKLLGFCLEGLKNE